MLWIYKYHAVAERTVMLSNDVSFSSCSDIGRNQEITLSEWIQESMLSIDSCISYKYSTLNDNYFVQAKLNDITCPL